MSKKEVVLRESLQTLQQMHNAAISEVNNAVNNANEKASLANAAAQNADDAVAAFTDILTEQNEEWSIL